MAEHSKLSVSYNNAMRRLFNFDLRCSTSAMLANNGILSLGGTQKKIHTVFDLISEHTLISGHPPILCW